MWRVKKMLRIVFLALITFFLSGCGPKIYNFSGANVIEDKLVKIHPPEGKFYSYDETFEPVHKSYDGAIVFYKTDIQGVRYTINFDSFNESYITDVKRYDYLFNSQLDWEEYEKELQAKDDMLEVEARWHGYRLEKVYLHNLACGLVSYSRSLASYANKSYSLECGYYAKDGTRKVFDIYHFYQTGFTKNSPFYVGTFDANYENRYSPIMAVEKDFQTRAKHMIESIELKEIDIAHMKKEGLYHEGKGQEFHYPIW